MGQGHTPGIGAHISQLCSQALRHASRTAHGYSHCTVLPLRRQEKTSRANTIKVTRQAVATNKYQGNASGCEESCDADFAIEKGLILRYETAVITLTE